VGVAPNYDVLMNIKIVPPTQCLILIKIVCAYLIMCKQNYFDPWTKKGVN
jgi:hypothetical protein